MRVKSARFATARSRELRVARRRTITARQIAGASPLRSEDKINGTAADRRKTDAEQAFSARTEYLQERARISRRFSRAAADRVNYSPRATIHDACR